MGSSQSDESTAARKKYKSRSKLPNKRPPPRIHGGPLELSKAVKKWKTFFYEILNSNELPFLEFWDQIKQALEAYIFDLQDENDMELQFSTKGTNITLPTHYGSNLSVHKESYISAREKRRGSKLQSFQLSVSSTSNMSMVNTVNPQSNSGQKSLMVSTQKTQFSLRTGFAQQIEKNEIILGLVKAFNSAWKEVYDKSIKNNQQPDQNVGLYRTLVDIIKRFVDIVVDLICSISGDFVGILNAELENEEITAFHFIEKIVLELIFDKFDTGLKHGLFQLLIPRHKDELVKLERALEKKHSEPLENYDNEVLPDSPLYLLDGDENRYHEVIEKIQKLRLLKNPHSKFEEINKILDEGLWNSVCSFYDSRKDMAQKLEKSKDSFGMELRLPIMIYCVVKSQCSELVIERAFIEEFVDPHLLDTSMGFTTFQCVLDYLIKEDGLVDLTWKLSMISNK